MKKSKDIGSFWLQLTQNGNLVGEFIDNVTKKIVTESADCRERDKLDSFVGTFGSTWLESDRPKSMVLEIDKNRSGTDELTWSDKNGVRNYGEAFLSGEEKLVGTYWVAEN
ncbi:hypothetical protein ACFQRK_04205 [Parapedobacter sp. GCM10030251]|uniref:hypothetical protein n=1 Tax=Parapedobacter sp. GCM10030251 TaxID=3273419 RepID=UPI003607EB05